MFGEVYYGGTCCGESRHSFKESIGETCDITADKKWKSTKEREYNPRYSHHKVSVSTTNSVVGMSAH